MQVDYCRDNRVEEIRRLGGKYLVNLNARCSPRVTPVIHVWLRYDGRNRETTGEGAGLRKTIGK